MASSNKSGTLYTYPKNIKAQRALIAAKISGVQIQTAKNFVFGETNNSADFLKKFPGGKVPAFESESGLCLTEADAIAFYLSNQDLKGGPCEKNQALVLQWILFAETEIAAPAATWVYPILGAMALNKSSSERAKADIQRVMKLLNEILLSSTYLVGQFLTLADITLATSLVSLYTHVFEPSFRNEFVNVNRWFTTIINQPSVKSVIGTVTLCTKMGVFDSKKYAEVSGGAKKSSEGTHSVKKADVVKAAPSSKKDSETATHHDLEEPKPEKVKDPLDLFPKGSFDMDDFKRFYSNKDENESIPYFWEKFDSAHYSIWRCDYKYADELSKVFMSCNLIGGMFQRLDKMRKNAFASVCLFGEDNNSAISGIWVWRGHELAFELSDDWKIDYASYDWKKLDASSEETKKLVNQYFRWEGSDLQGLKFNQGKIFK